MYTACFRLHVFILRGCHYHSHSTPASSFPSPLSPPLPSSQVLVVDDGSSDGTSPVALDLSRRFSSDSVRLLRMRRNGGKGAAVRNVRGEGGREGGREGGEGGRDGRTEGGGERRTVRGNS